MTANIARNMYKGFRGVLLLLFVISIFSPLLTPTALAGDNLTQGIKDYNDESYEEAIHFLSLELGVEPDSLEANYYLALSYKEIEKPLKAKEHLLKTTSLSPGYKETHKKLSEVYFSLGGYKNALSELGKYDGKDDGSLSMFRGIILLKLRDYTKATESFKNAKSINSKLTQAADYQISIAMVASSEIEKAKTLLNETILRDPNSDYGTYASFLLDRIKKGEKSKFHLNITAIHEYDDNVILMPSDLPPGLLSGVKQNDHKQIYTLTADYKMKLSTKWSLKGGYAFYTSDHSNLEAFNIISNTISLTPSYKIKKGTLSFDFKYNHVEVEHDSYLKLYSFTPSYCFNIKGDTCFRVSAFVKQNEFLEPAAARDEERDSLQGGGSLSYSKFILGREGFVKLSYSAYRDNTEGVNWDRNSQEGLITILIPVAVNVKFQVFSSVRHDRFRTENTFFGIKRKDSTYTSSALLSYNIAQNFKLTLQHRYIRGDSNLLVYDYKRNISTVALGLVF